MRSGKNENENEKKPDSSSTFLPYLSTSNFDLDVPLLHGQVSVVGLAHGDDASHSRREVSRDNRSRRSRSRSSSFGFFDHRIDPIVLALCAHLSSLAFGFDAPSNERRFSRLLRGVKDFSRCLLAA